MWQTTSFLQHILHEFLITKSSWIIFSFNLHYHVYYFLQKKAECNFTYATLMYLGLNIEKIYIDDLSEVKTAKERKSSKLAQLNKGKARQ